MLASPLIALVATVAQLLTQDTAQVPGAMVAFAAGFIGNALLFRKVLIGYGDDGRPVLSAIVDLYVLLFASIEKTLNAAETMRETLPTSTDS